MKNAALFIFSLILSVIIFSCNKEEVSDVSKLGDAQLIEAIQLATNKQVISPVELPVLSKEVLVSDYPESYTNIALKANDLGFEVALRIEKGSRVGERSQVYFDLNGRKLLADKDENGKHEYEGEEGDDDPSGNNEKDRNDCFKLVLPVMFSMPDGSSIAVENADGWTAIKEWYNAHPDSKERPALQFPVDVVFNDGATLTIADQEEMKALRERCGQGDGDTNNNQDGNKCFDFVYPVTFTLPDASLITIADKQDRLAIKEWYLAHPDVKERPALNFPVAIVFKGGKTLAITSIEDMKKARMACGERDSKRKCFIFVYPLTHIMPNGTEISMNDSEDRAAIKAWYAAHPDAKEKPGLKFPVEVIFKDGKTVTVTSSEEMKALNERCGGAKKEGCFNLVYPVTWVMPDGTEIEAADKGDWDAIKAWYEAHDDVKEKPALKYPLDIVYKDRTTVTLNNKEEMMAAKKECSEKETGKE